MSGSSNLATHVARLADGMILVATMDNGVDAEYTQNAKKLLKSFKTTSPSKCTIEAGPYYFHYIIENGVVYLTLAERGYPRRLAFQYLEEVNREFQRLYADEISRFSRPYAAVSFDPKMNKIRRDYLDPNAPGNLKKLNSDLQDIHNIMQQNINDVLQRGEKLDVMESRSSSLLSESKKFKKQARYINLQALWKMYGPVLAVAIIVLFVLYLRFF